MNDDENYFDEDGNEYGIFDTGKQREILQVMYDQLQIVGIDASTKHKLDVTYGWLFHAAQLSAMGISTCIESFNKMSFKDDDEQAKELTQYLLESREEKVKESIRRKVQK